MLPSEPEITSWVKLPIQSRTRQHQRLLVSPGRTTTRTPNSLADLMLQSALFDGSTKMNANEADPVRISICTSPIGSARDLPQRWFGAPACPRSDPFLDALHFLASTPEHRLMISSGASCDDLRENVKIQVHIPPQMGRKGSSNSFLALCSIPFGFIQASIRQSMGSVCCSFPIPMPGAEKTRSARYSG